MSEESAHLNAMYELDATAALQVRAGGHARVALQMRDELLHDAVAVAAAPTRRCNEGASVDVDAPSGSSLLRPRRHHPGSCCVDEVAAAHHRADAIVHFGRASNLPSRAFPRASSSTTLDVPACAAAIRDHAASIAAHDASCDQEYKTDALIVLVAEHAHEAATLRQSLLDSANAPAPLPPPSSSPSLVEPPQRTRAGGHSLMGGPASIVRDGGGGGAAARPRARRARAPSLTMAGSAAPRPRRQGRRCGIPRRRTRRRSAFRPSSRCGGPRTVRVRVGRGRGISRVDAGIGDASRRCRAVAQVDPATSALSAEATGLPRRWAA